MGTYHAANIRYNAEKDAVEILSRDGEILTERGLGLLIAEAFLSGKGSAANGRILVYVHSESAAKKQPEH